MNGEDWNITLLRESEGAYYYDYLAPMDDVGKNLLMEVLGQFNGTRGIGDGIANLDYYQILRTTQRLFLFLLRTDIDKEWRGIMLETCSRYIEEMTQLSMPSSLTRR